MDLCPIDYVTNSIFEHESSHHEVKGNISLVCIAKTVWEEVGICECKRTMLALPKRVKKMVQVSGYQMEYFWFVKNSRIEELI